MKQYSNAKGSPVIKGLMDAVAHFKDTAIPRCLVGHQWKSSKKFLDEALIQRFVPRHIWTNISRLDKLDQSPIIKNIMKASTAWWVNGFVISNRIVYKRPNGRDKVPSTSTETKELAIILSACPQGEKQTDASALTLADGWRTAKLQSRGQQGRGSFCSSVKSEKT